MSAETENWAK